MQEIKPTWSRGVVLVCGFERPAGTEPPSCGPKGAHELRLWLKDRIQEAGVKAQIRAVTTSCLGVCSAKGVTVALVPAHGGPQVNLLVDAQADREALWAQIRQALLGDAVTDGAS